jgi:hypothetical protein
MRVAHDSHNLSVFSGRFDTVAIFRVLRVHDVNPTAVRAARHWPAVTVELSAAFATDCHRTRGLFCCGVRIGVHLVVAQTKKQMTATADTIATDAMKASGQLVTASIDHSQSSAGGFG